MSVCKGRHDNRSDKDMLPFLQGTSLDSASVYPTKILVTPLGYQPNPFYPPSFERDLQRVRRCMMNMSFIQWRE